MRDNAITDGAIRKWLYDSILQIVRGGEAAEGLIGVVPINGRTIPGLLWTKFRTSHRADQKSPAFQFFHRLGEATQCIWIDAAIQHMIDNAIIKLETKANKPRLTTTTVLDALAKLGDG